MSTKEKEATDKPIKFGCTFCNREFARESTELKHICEQKRRYLDKDKHGNRIGFQSWVEFYKKNTSAKKTKTYDEFIRSAYYIAFIKFGNYCVNVNVLNVSRFTDWLLKNQIKIDNWCSDTTYSKYLYEYLRVEDAMDAIARSIETCVMKAQEEGILGQDYLRFGNSNKICYAITTGKISPWMLYCSNSGIRLLETLNPNQVTMINDYINPEQWALKFHREPDLKQQITDTLALAGY
jgi:hypothetical protein